MRTWMAGPVAAVALLLALVPGAAAEPVQVEVGVHLISFGNYDTAKGTYTMDLYLRMRHAADGNVTAERFEFMNGRAASRELLSDETVDGVRERWYRVQANLYSPPRFRDYPFDDQELQLVLEDTVHPADELVYALRETTLDADVVVAGWRVKGWEAEQDTKEYPFGESYSRITYTLRVGREPLSSALRSFLPPLAFMAVASFSFFFDRSQAASRLTLGTGMLISAVGFHISQTVALPPLGALSLFDKVMVAVYAFIGSTILVTTALSWGDKLALRPRAADLINRRGALLSLLVPVAVFLLLQLL